MDTALQELRFAVRTLTKNPAFTIVATLSLALGIGANATIFSIINGILLTPIPVEDPPSLAMVFTTDPSQGGIPGLGGLMPMSYLNYEDFRDQNDVFEQMTAVTFGGGILTGQDEPQQLPGFMVTHEYFDVLGVEPAVGRFFRADEDEIPGTHHVVVLSHGLWTRQFGADEQVIGQTISLNGVPFTVVGVAPEGFSGTVQGFAPDLVWTPFMTYQTLLPTNFQTWPDNRRALLMMTVLGRLRPGVSHETANAAIQTIAARLEQQYPDVNSNRSAEVTEFTALFNPTLSGQLGVMGGVLMVIVGLVLLIACANVANLLLARAATREKETGIRLALGAGRRRLVRQLLTESVLLSLIGAALGLLIAFWVGNLIGNLTPGLLAGGGFQFQFDTGLDARVFGFTFGIALLTGVLFGLVPALQSSNPHLAQTLHEGGRGGSQGKRQRFMRSSLVVGEIALALVALVCAGLFVRSLQAAQQIEPGFETYRLATVGLNPLGVGYDQGRTEQFYRELIEGSEALGRVESAAIAASRPLGFGPLLTLIPEGIADEDGIFTAANMVSPRYFETVGIPLLRGRGFTDFDDADSRTVAIINEAAQQLFWPDEDPIGRRFHFITEPFDIEVIGVAADTVSQIGQPIQPSAYLPLKQRYQGFAFLYIRTVDDPEPVLAEVQGMIREIDRDMPMIAPATIEQTLDTALAQSRIIASMLGGMGVLGLALALVGTYGLMSYAVNQQSREIGIRMALGAQAGEVMALVMKKGMALIGSGIAIGIVLAFGATRLLESLLFGVSTTDPVTFVGVPVLLIAVGLLANYLPARRALRVNPVSALRQE